MAGDGGADLEALVRRSGLGEVQAFAELYDATVEMVFGLQLHLLRDRARAATATLDCYVQVWTHAARFDDRRDSVRVWMSAIASRTASMSVPTAVHEA